jgi:carbon storage regulator CsrA
VLILPRKIGEFVQIGAGVQVHVLGVEDGRVRLGFVAPDDVLILRGPELVGRDGVPLDHSLLPPAMRK